MRDLTPALTRGGSEALLLMPYILKFEDVCLALPSSATKKPCRPSFELLQADNDSYWLSVLQVDPYREIKHNFEVRLIQGCALTRAQLSAVSSVGIPEFKADDQLTGELWQISLTWADMSLHVKGQVASIHKLRQLVNAVKNKEKLPLEAVDCTVLLCQSLLTANEWAGLPRSAWHASSSIQLRKRLLEIRCRHFP